MDCLYVISIQLVLTYESHNIIIITIIVVVVIINNIAFFIIINIIAFIIMNDITVINIITNIVVVFTKLLQPLRLLVCFSNIFPIKPPRLDWSDKWLISFYRNIHSYFFKINNKFKFTVKY